MNVLITGASRGLGYAMAVSLAKPGNTLYLHYHKHDAAAKSCLKAVESTGASGYLIQGDLSAEDDVNRIIAAVKKQTDVLDVLINNAGIMPPFRSKSAPWTMMQTVFSVNCQAPMALSFGVRDLLLNATTPCIINLGSDAAKTGYNSLAPEDYGSIVYAASKGAVESLTRGLARTFAPNIRVNAIAPGFVPTEIHQSRAESQDQVVDCLDEARQRTPLQCLGKDADINAVLLMLIDNLYMTGECIHVNGGLWMG